MIVAGFGFRGAARVESLADAYARACGQAGRGAQAMAAPQDKAGGALAALARAEGLPVIAVSPNELTAQETITQSQAAQAARGVGSVAEAAALAAAGHGARLIGPRALSADRMATCALAEGTGS